MAGLLVLILLEKPEKSAMLLLSAAQVKLNVNQLGAVLLKLKKNKSYRICVSVKNQEIWSIKYPCMQRELAQLQNSAHP